MGTDLHPLDPLAPHYEWAGTTIGAEMVYACGQCGALVRVNAVPTHTEYHQHVTAWLDQLNKGAGKHVAEVARTTPEGDLREQQVRPSPSDPVSEDSLPGE